MVDPQEQETLEECIARIEQTIARDRKGRLDNSRGHEREVILREPEQLAENKKHLLALLQFVQTCTVYVGKTKVLRVKNTHARGAFQHKGRFIMPNVTLVSGDRKVFIEYLEDVKDWEDKTEYPSGLVKREIRMPHIYLRWGYITFGSQWDRTASYYPFMEALAKAFQHSAGAHWQDICQQVRAEWKKVEDSLDQLVDAQFESKGDKERRDFQLKLMKMLGKTKGLIDAPPEAVYEIFKLGYDEIEKLARFTSRNKADIDLVTVEDIKTAQDEARVKDVMES